MEYTFSSLYHFQILEERKQLGAEGKKNQEAMDKIRKDLEGQMSKLNAQNEEKVTDLENRLQVALGNV